MVEVLSYFHPYNTLKNLTRSTHKWRQEGKRLRTKPLIDGHKKTPSPAGFSLYFSIPSNELPISILSFLLKSLLIGWPSHYPPPPLSLSLSLSQNLPPNTFFTCVCVCALLLVKLDGKNIEAKPKELCKH